MERSGKCGLCKLLLYGIKRGFEFERISGFENLDLSVLNALNHLYCSDNRLVSLEYNGENLYLTILSLSGTDISENIPTVIHASYNGKLMSTFAVLSTDKNDDRSYVYTGEIIGNDKIMLWDNLNTMQPLTKAMVLNL